MEITNPYRDYSNLLIILLKFLLVLAIGLQGLLHQLGLKLEEATGVVNATPNSQQSSDSIFNIAFYSLRYGPSAEFGSEEDKPIRITAWQCIVDADRSAGQSNNCSVNDPDWQALKKGELPSAWANNWVELGTKEVNPIDRDAPATLQSNRIQSVQFNLKSTTQSPDPLPGRYNMVYRLRFDRSLGRVDYHPKGQPSGIPFEVSYSPALEGDWRLPPVQIVRGREATVPRQLSGFKVLPGGSSVGATLEVDPRIRIKGTSDGRDTFELLTPKTDETSFDQHVLIQTQVDEDVRGGDNSFSAGTRRIRFDASTQFLKYVEEQDKYTAGDFTDVDQGDFVFYELVNGETEEDQDTPLASIVRFGSSVSALMPVVIMDNLPPRGIYAGSASSVKRAALFFPYNSFFSSDVDGISGTTNYFNLNNHIIDPDGRSEGRPSIHLSRGNFRKTGTWPSHFKLATRGRSTLLVFDPNRLNERVDSENKVTLQLDVSDEYSTVRMDVVVYRTPSEELTRLRRILIGLERGSRGGAR